MERSYGEPPLQRLFVPEELRNLLRRLWKNPRKTNSPAAKWGANGEYTAVSQLPHKPLTRTLEDGKILQHLSLKNDQHRLGIVMIQDDSCNDT